MKKFLNKKKIIIIIPLYNDWISAIKLIKKIKRLKINNVFIQILIINDFSKNINYFLNQKKSRLVTGLKIINLKKNFGHDRAIIIGMFYLLKKKVKFDYAITMDSDGEDNPKYLSKIINVSIKNPQKIIVCTRKKRENSLYFKFLYYSHLSILFLFTFKWMNHGGYNSINKENINLLLNHKNIWGNYSAVIETINIKKKYISTNRSKRFDGTSKTNFFKLLMHSFSIMSVFKKKIIFTSFIYISVLNIFFIKSYNFYNIFFLIFPFFFLLSLRESRDWKRFVFKNISYLKKIF